MGATQVQSIYQHPVLTHFIQLTFGKHGGKTSISSYQRIEVGRLEL